MSAWVQPSGTGAGAGSPGGGVRQFFNESHGGGSLGQVYQPTGSDAGAPTPAPTQTPGVISINPLDPRQSIDSAESGLGGLLDGLRNGIFGTDSIDASGNHGGLLGDVPLVGDVARVGAHVVGGAGAVLGGVAGALGGAAEHLPGSSIEGKVLDQQYEQLPAAFRAQWEQEHPSDTGIAGTGLFSDAEHQKSAALRAYQSDQQVQGSPTLLGGKLVSSGSIADTISNVMDLLSTPEQLAERASAGWSKANGQNRLQDAVALAKAGQATPVEELAAVKFQNGTWSESEALDFLASHGAGFAHDSATQIAASVLLDPLNAAAFGAGALAKLGASGVEFAAGADKAASLLSEAQDGLKAAEASGEADRIAQATEDVSKAQKSVDSFKAYQGTQAPRTINVLGRAAQGSEKAAALLKVAGRTYAGLEGTSIGTAAKAVRTLIDPLHAMDLHMPGAGRMVDLLSDVLPKTLVDTISPRAYGQLLDDFATLDPSGATRDLFTRDIATAVANRGREGVADLHRAGEVNAGLGESLMRTVPGDVIDEAIKAVKERDLQRWLRYDVTKNVMIRDWPTAAKETLANQLASVYHVRSADEWLKEFEHLSPEHLSFLKHAVYGNSNRQLLDGLAESATHPSAAVFDYNRMVLLAKGTLSRLGGEGLLNQIKKARGQASKVALIRDWQERYPTLRYVVLDEANLGKSITDFENWLGDRLDSLPMEVTHDELQQMHPTLQDLQANLGDGYSLGFRPKDEFLWGLERTNAKGGAYAIATNPWVDHVADGGLGYRPGHDLTLNIAGHAIPGLSKAGKAIDYIEEGARVLKAQVSGAQIAEAARQRFVSSASRGKFAEHGLTESVAQHWWERINEFTREHQGYSGPRGFGDGDLYNALFGKGLIPHPMLNGATRIEPRDVMQMVLDAYDGDMRFIGLTQKLTGRAKAYLHETTGSNFLGQVAEHAWPTMKFMYNPIFQLQEKIEPWVLNAQRGVAVATGVKMSEADRATESLLQRLTDNSVIRQSDLPDQGEYSAQVLLGKGYDALAATAGTRLAQMKKAASALLDVQGVKRLNMLRTFRDGLGSELRSVWDKTHPGVWQDMKTLADARAGRVLSDDEFALHLMGEQLFSNDIVATRLAKTARFHVDPANAIKTGAWHTPASLGELQGLDLDHVARSLRLPGDDGKSLQNLADLRRYIGDDNSRVNDVVEGLNRLGADPDYVQRVHNALTFSWTGFWKSAEERFGLTAEDSRSLQTMVAQAADLRGMSPADFMSQVFAPGIKDGAEGMLGSLSSAKDLRATLAGKTGESTREDLVRQMSAVFADYLDPSAKRALLMEFKPELRQAVMDGRVKMDLQDLQSMWDSQASDTLADRIIGYMDGKTGTAAHDVVTEDAKGVAAVRKGATKYMTDRGVTPQPERRYYAGDQALSEDTAAAYGALPETSFDVTGRVPNVGAVRKAGLDLKPQPAGVDDRSYSAYRDFVQETRAQWDHMTGTRKQGGMGIDVTVSKTDPYADSAAMRADVAKGRLRVLGANSDHPLMTNEQNVMFRAVHDVFGHAAEGFEFGPRGELNAAAKHASMYSDTSRAAMLSETHGQNSWVNFSNDGVPGAEAFKPATTFDEAKAAYAKLQPDVSGVAIDKAVSPEVVWDYDTAIGPGIETLARNGLEGEMTDLLNQVTALRHQFPQVPLPNLDTFDIAQFYGPGVSGATIGAAKSHTAILLNEKLWTDPNYVARTAEGEASFAKFKPGDAIVADGEARIRQSDVGAPWAQSSGPADVVRHEYTHAIDTWVRYGDSGLNEDAVAAYEDFMDLFDAGGPKWMQRAKAQLSEYAHTSDEEAAAELGTIMLNPAIDRSALPPELRRAVETLQGHYDSLGLRVAPPEAAAQQTVREANGSVYAPQKAALLPQDILDRFGSQFVGAGKHIESNPDVARAAQMFGKWSTHVVEDGLLKGEQSVHGSLLHDIAGLPTKDAVPYNLTEGMLLQQATQAMADKWRDAYRLQYFAQERSMLERSINHPMFGLYPASYMWGKLGPEIVRFVAQKPFGVRTGALAHSLTDAQAAVALQREYDPAFDAHIQKLGHSQALSFAGYLLPTLPWDVSASAPIWMKDIAAQGLKAESSGTAQSFDALKPAVDTLNKLNPLATTLPWAARAAGEVTSGSDKQDLTSVVDQPITGANLGTPLTLVLQELRDALSR